MDIQILQDQINTKMQQAQAIIQEAQGIVYILKNPFRRFVMD